MGKMKIFVYNYREFDEAEYFQKFSEKYDVELGICTDAPTLENDRLAEGAVYKRQIGDTESECEEEYSKLMYENGIQEMCIRDRCRRIISRQWRRDCRNLW